VTDNADTSTAQPAFPPPQPAAPEPPAVPAADRPELMLGAAFAGGLLAALILKRLAR
jgi:hypothetical protein